MGIIEDLRRQKAAAAEEAASAKAKSDELRKADNEKKTKEYEEEKAIRLAKGKALYSTIVPQLTQELAGLINGRFDSRDGRDGKIGIDMYTHVDRVIGIWKVKLTFTSYSIDIEGQPDGTVKIGEKKLSQTEANNFNIVDDALKNAYLNPTIKKEVSQISKEVYSREPSRSFTDSG